MPLSTPDTDPPNDLERQVQMSYGVTIDAWTPQPMCHCCLCRGIDTCDGNHPGHSHRLARWSQLFDPDRW